MAASQPSPRCARQSWPVYSSHSACGGGEVALGVGRPHHGGDGPHQRAVALLADRQVALGPLQRGHVDQGEDHPVDDPAGPVGQDAQEVGLALPVAAPPARRCTPDLQHPLQVVQQVLVLDVVGERIQPPAHVLGQQVEGLADLGGELAQPQLAVDEQGVHLGGLEQVVHVRRELGQLGDLGSGTRG